MKRRWRALLAILCGCATLWLAASGWAKAAPTVTYNSCNGFEEEGMPVASIVMGEELGRWGPGRSGGLILSGGVAVSMVRLLVDSD